MTVTITGQPEEAPPTLTEEQARAAYEALVAGLARNYGYDPAELPPHPTVRQGTGVNWPGGPVLCADFEGWSSTTAWAVVWEGGPYDWSMYVNGGTSYEFQGFPLELAPIELPAGVWTEPINGYSLGLYVHEGPATVPGLAEPLPGSEVDQ